VIRDEIYISTDLGSSSNYSNELLRVEQSILRRALKAEEEKVFLRLALTQESVGPKCSEKSYKPMNTKGK